MFIQTENTPNPNTIKFHPGVEVMASGTADFRDREAATRSPLAERLFDVLGVEGVFFSQDYLSITKKEDGNWDSMKPHVLTAIMEHFVAGRPLFKDDSRAGIAEASSSTEEDSDIVRQIKELIDTRVRPAVAEDGGDIIYRSFDDGIVKLELYGACSGCPSSTMTLKQGIENMLKHYVPEVVAVEAVNG
ncbi:MAG: NifU family protein [Hyphomicrobiales bacterium]|nr:NifU family protein [Hyphomicrobiales bacterium]